MKIDRYFGSILDSYPKLKKYLKPIYLRSIYLLTPKRVSSYNSCVKSYDGFFGYYDKSPWHSSSRLYVYHQQSNRDLQKLDIMLVNMENDSIVKLDSTISWNWQQGAMLQWLPGKNAVIFNIVENNKLLSKVAAVDSRYTHISRMPVQTVHPNGEEALSLNYRRLNQLAPGYGYSVEVENFMDDQSLNHDGIWHFNIFDSAVELIISLADLSKNETRSEMKDAKHKVNHILYSPDGSKFVFMHRWIGNKGKFSRLYVCDYPYGRNLEILMDDRMVSHYSWRDNDNLLVYGRIKETGDRYYLINVNSKIMQVIGKDILDLHGDGHPTFSPNRKFLITDTYPDKARMRHLLLYDFENKKCSTVGRFFSPWKFDGPTRVDLHPRWSPCGTKISIDSAHEGERKNYIIDVKEFV